MQELRSPKKEQVVWAAKIEKLEMSSLAAQCNCLASGGLAVDSKILPETFVLEFAAIVAAMAVHVIHKRGIEACDEAHDRVLIDLLMFATLPVCILEESRARIVSSGSGAKIVTIILFGGNALPDFSVRNRDRVCES